MAWRPLADGEALQGAMRGEIAEVTRIMLYTLGRELWVRESRFGDKARDHCNMVDGVCDTGFGGVALTHGGRAVTATWQVLPDISSNAGRAYAPTRPMRSWSLPNSPRDRPLW
ncbi:hypothetical protein ACFQ1S_06805, partial [Kibdelosporangium lantanae]